MGKVARSYMADKSRFTTKKMGISGFTQKKKTRKSVTYFSPIIFVFGNSLVEWLKRVTIIKEKVIQSENVS